MSNDTIPARATGLPDFAAAVAKITAARAAISPLSGLKERQRRAWAHFEEISDFSDYISEDDPTFPLLKAEVEVRSAAEAKAMLAVCAYPAQTLAEARSKARFLLKAMQGCLFTEDQVQALLSSFLTVAENEVINAGANAYD
ncbi:hypothetical protein [uncultured Rhodoblastus sp.]|uniref:hypothetical protein n=1 Tax=uncultured Rhodoblastus sp. TaxID=543037 RepID=UPI00260031F5|nr:hypothetical protein [uncultured Rhodoblastus sp.]